MIEGNYEIRFSATMRDKYRPIDELKYEEFDTVLEAIAYIKTHEKSPYEIWTIEVIDWERVKD